MFYDVEVDHVANIKTKLIHDLAQSELKVDALPSEVFNAHLVKLAAAVKFCGGQTVFAGKPAEDVVSTLAVELNNNGMCVFQIDFNEKEVFEFVVRYARKTDKILVYVHSL